MTDTTTTERDLEILYIERVNQAVAEDRYELVDALANEFDVELEALRAA